jgi:hypothetical protein
MFEHGHISPEPTSASPHNSAFDVEILRGHFFKLDLFEIENDIGEKCVMGGSLQYGTDSVTLDPDHARHLANQVRAAIDGAIAGTVMQRPSHCSKGH